MTCLNFYWRLSFLVLNEQPAWAGNKKSEILAFMGIYFQFGVGSLFEALTWSVFLVNYVFLPFNACICFCLCGFFLKIRNWLISLDVFFCLSLCDLENFSLRSSDCSLFMFANTWGGVFVLHWFVLVPVAALCP